MKFKRYTVFMNLNFVHSRHLQSNELGYLQGRNSWGVWGCNPPPPHHHQCSNIAVLSGNFNERSSGKKYVIQRKILHNFWKSNNCTKLRPWIFNNYIMSSSRIYELIADEVRKARGYIVL